MNWNRDMTVIDGRLYAGDRWLGSFSSHERALGGIQIMRNPMQPYFGPALAESDIDLLAAIDADEA
ncbi:hypothetical protein [Paraburkholderia phenoliruptrix]|uniref:hypothetical protein n=1 Tax=Paraburkholderia phenoliruptrix TaxID=252970 RepID=UPI002867A486|nr:hypothetical protein [Paraburkholderia phenoliruptrix]MDR6389180.1 hypothetical protein [Paraburkholderia phenoliruptrix]